MADNRRPSEPMPAPAELIHDPNPPEVIPVHSRRIACDGVGGALGHPRVWLEMGEGDFVECGYCDRRFVLTGAGADGGVAVGAGRLRGSRRPLGVAAGNRAFASVRHHRHRHGHRDPRAGFRVRAPAHGDAILRREGPSG